VVSEHAAQASEDKSEGGEVGDVLGMFEHTKKGDSSFEF
jgi:hypothetical protein